MINPTTQAPHLARDIAAIVQVPKTLATAMAAHDAAVSSDTEPGTDIALECMTVAPEDVESLIARAATDQVARKELPAARGEVAELLARRIMRELAVAGPAILEGARPVFLEAAEAYTAAVAVLPADTRPEALVNAGSAVLASYEQAVSAAGTMTALRQIRDQLADLGVRAPGDQRVEQWTRYLDLEDAAAIDSAQRAGTSGPLGRWHGWTRATGVRRLWWPSIAEQTEAVVRISAMLPKRNPKKDPTVRLRGVKVA